MTEMIKITLDEIKSEKLSVPKQVKVFATAVVLIPVAMIMHIAVTLWGVFAIPNSVVDIITLSEKTKQAVNRKCNDTP